MSSRKEDKKSTNPNSDVCSNCAASNVPKLSACSRCGVVVYCSKACQRAHWKFSHKKYCIAKADRAPQLQTSLNASQDAQSPVAAEEKCAICLNLLSDEPASTLSCTHVFHTSCVLELQKLDVKQACPLCRSSLTPGPVELFDEATRRYVMVQRRVLRGLATWSALPTSAQLEMDAAITGWRAAADQGSAMAQFLLGDVYEKGHGVAEDEEEAAHWFRKAANQGHVLAQQCLGALLARRGGDAQRDKEAVL